MAFYIRYQAEVPAAGLKMKLHRLQTMVPVAHPGKALLRLVAKQAGPKIYSVAEKAGPKTYPVAEKAGLKMYPVAAPRSIRSKSSGATGTLY